MKKLLLLLLTILITQISFADSGRCKANMRDKDDQIIDTFSVWSPNYNRSCELALINCNEIMDSRIRDGETELNLGQCSAEWQNSLPSRPQRRMAKNYCSVYLKNLKTGSIFETFVDMQRGPKGFSSWMTACNKAMTKCMLNRPLINRRIVDCVREKFEE